VYGSNNDRRQYTYDALGRAYHTNHVLDGYIRTATYTYDLRDRLKRTTITGSAPGFYAEYAYDTLSRTTQKTTSWSTGTTRHSIDANYSYLPGPNSNTTALVENLEVRRKSPTYDLLRYNFTYTYNKKSQITSVTDSAVSPAKAASYEYDALGQLIRENNPYSNKTVTYKYDQGGNILQRKTYGYTTANAATVAAATPSAV